ncbi:malate dehydrogenase [Bacillus sp. Marseille-P3661]|uniref:malate dehydrogenase n=1 Tax=Bacillus sp. Marseille-P3661 TaxID=1936234 RepID=UPI000C82E05C|nr:hypothetical protein [Bacillus sp. Marseille-P3661]
MSKVSIIGAGGTLGSSFGFMLALKDIYDEICLIDKNRNLVLNHLMDMENALVGQTKTRLYAGEMEDLKGSHVVFVTASIPNQNVTSRLVFLEGNIKVMDEIGAEIKKFAPEAIIVTATNPTDILNYYLHTKFKFDRQKLIGYNLNDSKRFEWAIRDVLGLSGTDKLFSPVLGEHGGSQVPVYSKVQLNGQQANFKDELKELIDHKVNSWFVQFNDLKINRTTGWTSAIGLTEVAMGLAVSKPTFILGSAILTGEYGLSDLSIGVPMLINNEGIVEVQEWELQEDEYNELLKSAANIKKNMSVHQ